MYYQTDFRSVHVPFHPNFIQHKVFGRFRKNRKGKVSPLESTKENKKNKGQSEHFIERWFSSFCDNTSVHGMKYIGQKNFHWSEKTIWSILVLSAIFGIIYISLELSAKFSNSPLSTVVESTIFPVSEIAYPAITICNRNRFHRERTLEAESMFIPQADDKTIELFRLLLLSMNQLEFGSFDEFYDEVFNFTSPMLDSLNLTEIFHFVMLRCEEIFIGRCWWRNKYLDCCNGFFELQNSEYALCYSFNSAVNEKGIAMEVK